jgi:hypothetical protein
MANVRWRAGAVISKALPDGWTYYGRLLEFPWVAFYKHRTKAASDDVEAVTGSQVLFTLAAHKDLTAPSEWRTIGQQPLEPSLGPPHAQAVWDDDGSCQIIDAEGEMRAATPAECKGLEPAAVWEPDHIADRLQDTFAGRENPWLRNLMPTQN